jgi:hypothetical protein
VSARWDSYSLTSLDGNYKTILDNFHKIYLILIFWRLEIVTASVTARIAVKLICMGSEKIV